jgi:hypothetical protein
MAQRTSRRGQRASVIAPVDNVDWVTSHFTEFGIYTSHNGQNHASPNDRYYLTKYGYAVGESKVLWPTKRRYGVRNASPDPRQL